MQHISQNTGEVINKFAGLLTPMHEKQWEIQLIKSHFLAYKSSAAFNSSTEVDLQQIYNATEQEK